MCFASGSVSAACNGTATAPSRHAPYIAEAKDGWFGTQIATRSPGPTPRAASASAAPSARARSCPNVISAPSKTRATASGVRAAVASSACARFTSASAPLATS